MAEAVADTPAAADIDNSVRGRELQHRAAGKMAALFRLVPVILCRSTASPVTADHGSMRPAAYNQSVNRSNIKTVTKVAEANFPTRWGQFRIYGFEGDFENLLDSVSPEEADRLAREGKAERRKEDAVALVMGNIHSAPPLVRIHSQCLTGDVFHSMRCDCRQQLELALSMIADAGAGILIYEQQEGRGIGLMAKLQAYELQDKGLDTVEANVELGYDNDYRQYKLPAEILRQLGVKQVRLISNNPEKVAAVENAGIKVVERVPADVEPYEHSENYLKTKKEKMGHLFTTW
ncbi:MAG: GTP cyclohydrolase II [Candidatus Korobacteraceae bacterium]